MTSRTPLLKNYGFGNFKNNMSTKDFKIVKIVDDRINVDAPKFLIAEDGPSSSTYQVVTPSDPSTLNPVFTVQLPSNATGLNRRMYWRMRGTLTLTGTNLETLQLTNRVAFRQFPLQSACTSVQVQINDSTLSIGNIGQIISGLLRKGLTSKTLGQGLSDVNCAPDLTANYSQAVGASGIFDPPGNAPYSNYTSQSRCQGITGFAVAPPGPGSTSMTLTFDIQEPVVCPPFEYGDSASSKSLFGINTLQITANMANFHRMLSIALDGTTATVSAVTVVPDLQQLHVGFVTPKDRSVVQREKEYIYGYTNVQSFISTMTSGAVLTGTTVTGTSNVIDLPVVPKGFIVYATYSETDRSNPALSLPDICLPIQSIQCSFMTRSGLLAGATAEQLYQMNVKNGVSFPAWAHFGDQLIGSSSVAPFPRGCGNMLYIDSAQDLSLPDGVTPGMAVRAQFAVDSVTCLNPYTGSLVAPRLIVIALTDGLLRNKDGASSTVLGGIPDKDDERLKDATTTLRSDLTRMSMDGGYGGGFFDFLKKAAKTILPIAGPIASMLVPELAPVVGLAQKALGGARRGGAMLGGAMLGGASQVSRANDNRRRAGAQLAGAMEN